MNIDRPTHLLPRFTAFYVDQWVVRGGDVFEDRSARPSDCVSTIEAWKLFRAWMHTKQRAEEDPITLQMLVASTSRIGFVTAMNRRFGRDYLAGAFRYYALRKTEAERGQCVP